MADKYHGASDKMLVDSLLTWAVETMCSWLLFCCSNGLISFCRPARSKPSVCTSCRLSSASSWRTSTWPRRQQSEINTSAMSLCSDGSEYQVSLLDTPVVPGECCSSGPAACGDWRQRLHAASLSLSYPAGHFCQLMKSLSLYHCSGVLLPL